jgi:sporulation protein YlmC with PRC-barrel domain
VTPGYLMYRSSAEAQIQSQATQAFERDRNRAEDDSHLRSTREVIGYHIQATDGELGHVEDFLVDPESWAIRYAIVDTSNWWFGMTVLIAPDWISEVSWEDSKVFVDVNRHSVKAAPEYDPHAAIDRRWEREYYAHHGRQGYWEPRDSHATPLVSLKQDRELGVATADRDPRGWKVVTAGDGRTIGTVDDLIADPSTMKVRYLDVEVESRHAHILLPVGYARLDDRDGRVMAEGLTADDLGRVPAYDDLPVDPGYDETFRESVRSGPAGGRADEWMVDRRESRDR